MVRRKDLKTRYKGRSCRSHDHFSLTRPLIFTMTRFINIPQQNSRFKEKKEREVRFNRLAHKS